MRTEVRLRQPVGRSTIAPLLTVSLLALLAASIVRLQDVGATAPTPDLGRFGISVTPASTTPVIDRTAAIDVVRREYGATIDGGEIWAEFARTTEPATSRSDDPIVERDVWVIVVTGLSIAAPAPITVDGVPAKAHELTTAVFYVDGRTGEWLFSRFEGS